MYMYIFLFVFLFLLGVDYAEPKRKGNFVGKIFLAAALTTLCIIMIKRSPSLNPPSPVILCSMISSSTHKPLPWLTKYIYVYVMYLLYRFVYAQIILYIVCGVLIYLYKHIRNSELDLGEVSILLFDCSATEKYREVVDKSLIEKMGFSHCLCC